MKEEKDVGGADGGIGGSFSLAIKPTSRAYIFKVTFVRDRSIR